MGIGVMADFAISVLWIVLGFFLGTITTAWFTALSEYKNSHPLLNSYPKKKERYEYMQKIMVSIEHGIVFLALVFIVYAIWDTYLVINS
ncbi:hypothetical protein SAMN04488589_0486 [Methanolobus vulcani]|jgi:hypothetical protein|uniref:Uncharacterized protein n=1 Tax=Methanolobus vulcani TaxID=38026 RepID=A0A7Z7AXC5_9EURY|nr:hypothetical protein [Methanolobus vulcani]SDF36702.1 hypothetical protein SAMN04488589_0486 [Methanolobus vulcani]